MASMPPWSTWPLRPWARWYVDARMLFGTCAPPLREHNQMACLVRVPTDVVKQLRQAGVHKTIGDAATSVLAAYGPRGFYVAYWPTLIREVAVSSCRDLLY